MSLHQLIAHWLTSPVKPCPEEIPLLLRTLWLAAAVSAEEKIRIGIYWTPTDDPSVQWAALYLRSVIIPSTRIPDDLRANAEFLILHPPCPVSSKQLAANDP
jgi:hypothetical protein